MTNNNENFTFKRSKTATWTQNNYILTTLAFIVFSALLLAGLEMQIYIITTLKDAKDYIGKCTEYAFVCLEPLCKQNFLFELDMT